MNPQTLMIEAWLQAAAERPRPPGCLSTESLEGLARGDLAEREARLSMLHLTQCSECRSAFARLAALSAAPARPVTLRELLAQEELQPAWRTWLHTLVYRLPLETE